MTMNRAVAFLLFILATRDSLANIGQNECGMCGDPIDIVLIFRNVLQEPKFQFQVTVLNKPQRSLQFFLEEAAKKDKRARFTSSYWGDLGYMIDSINKVEASLENKTFWKIHEYTTGDAHTLGPTSHIPEHREIIQFNFTTWN